MNTDPLLHNLPAGTDLDALRRFGFRFGDKGAHTSRTIMLQELEILLKTVPQSAARADYDQSIIEENCLGKQTVASRTITAQRLRELYALDPAVPLFRLFRLLQAMDERSTSLLALFTALARDPILRLTAESILDLAPGQELSRQNLFELLAASLQSRLNEATIDKVLRNTAASWTHSGHLAGRMRKVRRQVEPSLFVVTHALLLGHLTGHRGQALLHTLWARLLDLNEGRILDYTLDARRIGLLEMTQAGGVMAISFNTLLTAEERRLAYGTH